MSKSLFQWGAAPLGDIRGVIAKFEAVTTFCLPLGDIRGVIVIVHGLGEHSKRYEALTSWLVEREYAVWAYDHYGHGQSPGKRGDLQVAEQLTNDLHDMIARAEKRFTTKPIYLLGHSMGGLVALDYARTHPHDIAGVIALSPALAIDIPIIQRWFLPLMNRFFPDLVMDNGLPVSAITHDQATLEAYRHDPLGHHKITPRLAQYLVEAGAQVRAAAPQWSVPTLLMYAGADKLVNPQGSAEFAQQAPEERVTAHCFSTAYHELHHEPDTNDFYHYLEQWLKATR